MTDHPETPAQKLTVKAYLDHVRNKQQAVQAYADRVREVSALLDVAGVDYSKPRSQGGYHGDTTADRVARLIDARRGLIKAMDEARGECEHAFELCQATEETRLLWALWVERVPVAEACERLFICKSSAHRMRRRGIVQLYHAMPERWRDALPKAV